MSYARWSNSNWYAFDNVSGLFSLWHIKEPHSDYDYDLLRDVSAQGQLSEWLSREYPNATVSDIEEAAGIIALALDDAQGDEVTA